DDGDILTTGCGVDSFRSTDGRQVIIVLIGEDDVVRQCALEAGGHSGSTSMGRFYHIAVKIIVRHNRAADRAYAYGLSFHTQLVNDLRHQTVDNAVGTSRAVMEGGIRKGMGFFKNNSHYFAPPEIS